MDRLLEKANDNLTELLGLTPPPVEVFTDRRYEEGRRIDDGRRLASDDLAVEVIGKPTPGWPLHKRPSMHFEFDVPSTGDGAWLAVMDLSEDATGPVDAIFSPYRTCVGVVLATALALAAAEQTGGEFHDREIWMLEPPVANPREVIDRTKLTPGGCGFAASCERYLRQFPQLNGWPRDVSRSHPHS